MSEAPGPEAVSGGLLASLRRQAREPELRFRFAPVPVRGGYDTRIYAFELDGAPPGWQSPLVARVFRKDEAGRARYEAAMQSAIAATGFPCPAPVCLEEDPEPVGGPFIVMPRVAGVPLLQAALRPSPLLFRVPRILADTHLRLHALDPEPVLANLAAAGVDRDRAILRGNWLPLLASQVEAWSLEGLRPGLRWLEAHQPAPVQPVVCHLDFHPLNILFDSGRVTGVIDWAASAVADPAFDVAVARVIMTMGPLGGGIFQPAFDAVRRWLANRYTAAYCARRPIPPDRIRYYEALRCFAAMVHVGMRRKSGEVAAHGYAWDQPAQVRMMTGHFQRVSGVPLVLD